MDKRLLLQLNANRKVTGVLRGFDPFMNIVLDDAVEERTQEERIPMGLAVSASPAAGRRLTHHAQMVRGNSIVMVEALERISQ